MYKKIITTGIIGAFAASNIALPIQIYADNSAMNYILVQYLKNEIDTNISSESLITPDLLNQQYTFIDSNTESQLDRESLYEYVDLYQIQLLEEYIISRTNDYGEIIVSDELINYFETSIGFLKTPNLITEVESALQNIREIHMVSVNLDSYLSEEFDLLNAITINDIDELEIIIAKQRDSIFKTELLEKANTLRNIFSFAFLQAHFDDSDAAELTFSKLAELEEALTNVSFSEEQFAEFSNTISQKRLELVNNILNKYTDIIVTFENLDSLQSDIVILSEEISRFENEEPAIYNHFVYLKNIHEIVKQVSSLFDDSGNPIPMLYSNLKLDSIKTKIPSETNENQIVFLDSIFTSLEIALFEQGNEKSVEFNNSNMNHRQIFKEGEVVQFIFDEAIVRIKENDLIALGEGDLKISFIRDLVNKFFEITIQQKIDSETSTYQDAKVEFNYDITLNTPIDSNEFISNVTETHEHFVWHTTKDGQTRLKANDIGKFEIKTKNYSEFSDVDISTDTGKVIKKLYENRLLRGITNTKFGGERGLTRGEAATIMLRVMGKTPLENYNQTFRDTKKGSWYYDSVSAASHYGYMGGLTKFEFMPNKVVTKEEAAVIIHRLLKLNNITLSTGNSNRISDLNDASAFSKNSIQKLVNAGVIRLESGKFNPKSTITRNEMASLLENALGTY